MSSASNTSIERFYWLDTLRGTAALVIVIYHYHHFYLRDAFGRDAIPSIETFPYHSLVGVIYSPVASHAVELFWLISGFVFAHVYLNRHASFLSFGAARFARLYPLHFLTLLLVAVIQYVSLTSVGHWQIFGNNDAPHFLLQLVMASNWTTLAKGNSFNGPIWSVSVEMLVYGLFFLSLALLRRATVLWSAILSLAGWLCYLSLRDKAILLEPLVLACVGYFYLGALLYALKPHRSLRAAAICILLGVAVGATGQVLDLGPLKIAALSVVLVTGATVLDQFWLNGGRRLSVLGDISYSVYLVHVPLQMLVLLGADMFLGGTRSFADSPLTLPVYVLMSVAVAYVVNRCIERPAGRAIRNRIMPQVRTARLGGGGV